MPTPERKLKIQRVEAAISGKTKQKPESFSKIKTIVCYSRVDDKQSQKSLSQSCRKQGRHEKENKAKNISIAKLLE